MCIVYFFLYILRLLMLFHFFFFNDTATTEIYTLSLHDALPIYFNDVGDRNARGSLTFTGALTADPQNRSRTGVSLADMLDRKSTRLNSSHQIISYAVFCLKKKKEILFLNQGDNYCIRAR